MRHLIALIGLAGSGKTSLANALELRLGYVRKPLATPIKAMIGVFLEIQGLKSHTIDEMLNGSLKEKQTVYLGGNSPRRAMQTLGTEWRDLLDKNLWIDAWARGVAQGFDDVVVDDVRFPHEAEVIRRLKGKIIRIHRPRLQLVEEHASEAEHLKIKPDFEINNNGSLADLFDAFCDTNIERN